MSAAARAIDMDIGAISVFALLLLKDAIMPVNDPTRALKLEISQNARGEISVALKAQSLHNQRVSYQLKTSGASTTVHKGETHLRADEAAIISNIRFSANDEWCVSLDVQEERGPSYTIRDGNRCNDQEPGVVHK